MSAIEFAVIAPITVMLLLGAYDFGNAAQEQIALQQAVADAGAYALTNPTSFTRIKTAVTNAFPASTPGLLCGCINISTGLPATPAGCNTTTPATSWSTCTGSNAGKAIYITATAPYTHVGSMFSNAIGSNAAEYVVRFQ